MKFLLFKYFPGTDGTAIVQTVSSCSNAQRQEIKKQFYNLYNKVSIYKCNRGQSIKKIIKISI